MSNSTPPVDSDVPGKQTGETPIPLILYDPKWSAGPQTLPKMGFFKGRDGSLAVPAGFFSCIDNFHHGGQKMHIIVKILSHLTIFLFIY